jgi:hypothetical protein
VVEHVEDWLLDEDVENILHVAKAVLDGLWIPSAVAE